MIHERQEEVLELMPAAGEAEQENQEVLFSTLIIWHESKFSGHFFHFFTLKLLIIAYDIGDWNVEEVGGCESHSGEKQPALC